jgi:type I restriction enzyme S subunit
MISWPYRPLSDFLTEREGRFKPNDPKIATFKRLDKIDFSGQIHISEKPSKTDMIVIEPGDLVISGINVAKGALAVYEGDEPVTATIHYSSYTFDKNRIDIAFLKRFLKSPAFISELQDQVKGGIKTEIKPKHLLPLKARIPELAKQQKINHHFDAVENEISDLSNEIYSQSTYLTKLRQAILQEAIEGKLTADWRKENPVRKGDPDYDAEALLEKIQAEKEKLIKEGKIKKQKPLAPIKADEVPFELPEGWVWTRLRELSLSTEAGKSFLCKDEPVLGKSWGVIKTSAITSGNFIEEESKLYSHNEPTDTKSKIKTDDFLFCRASGSKGLAGRSCIVDKITKNLLLSDKSIRLILSEFIEPTLINHINNCEFGEKYRLSLSTNKSTSMNNVQREEMLALPIPLAGIAEQKVIIQRVEKAFFMVEELEKQVSDRKKQSEQLMQAVLREAFEGAK